MRIRDLGAVESTLVRRSRLVSNYTKLVFVSPPTSVADKPPNLDNHRTGSSEFVLYRTWLVSQLDTLCATAKIGDKDADHRLEWLRRRFEKEILRLVELIRVAWEKEKINAGLIRFDPSIYPEPVPAPRGKPVCIGFDMIM